MTTGRPVPLTVDRGASRVHEMLHILAAVILSAYPLSLMLRENLGVVPIGAATWLWVVGVDLVLVTGLFWILRFVTRDVAARAAWLGVFFLLFGAYSVVLQLAAALGWPLRPDRPVVAVSYTLVSVAIATITTRPARLRRRDPIPLLMIGGILVGTNAVTGLARAATFAGAIGDSADGWRPAAAALIEASTAAQHRLPRPAQDIYYIVLDGFGRADVLERFYGLDLRDFTAFLQTRGFHVPQKARSNYAQTYLSLGSTLNLAYVDDVARVVGRGGSNRDPLAYLVDHNALMTVAKRTGYQVVGIGSDYIATERIRAADVCICDQYGSSMTEQLVFAATPLVGVSLGQHAFDAHRRKVDEAFDVLEQPRAGSPASFVFAHVIAPHPPFVFRPDGTAAPSRGLFLFQDGSHYPGSRDDYRRGYRDQVQYVINRVMAAVDALLSRDGPPPVIVLHGDHGPGSMLDWDSAERTNMAERFGVFAAYHLPGARAQPYPTMTLVNGARLVANEYLGTDLPPLEDRSLFSTWERPYDLVPVTDTELSP
jgi:hypothetical protein